jgi:hypothetical protein
MELDIWHAQVHPQQQKSSWKMELWAFKLSEREWTLVEQLQDVLEVRLAQFYGFQVKPLMLSAHQFSISQILKDATLFFSWDMLNLTMVIPVMDHMDEVLGVKDSVSAWMIKC